jgi:LysM repeat protein
MAYRVQPGDTLWAIAQRNHTTVAQLLRLNPQLASNPNRIMPGWAVVLPGGGGAPRPGPSAPVTSGVHGQPPPSAHPPVPTASPIVVGPGGRPVPPGAGGGPPSVSFGTPNNGNLLNELTGLPGSERDAYAALSTLFNSYGLGSLAPVILKYLQQGFGSDTITILLQQTPEYKARFAGNQARIKNGLQVLTPAEYLSTEASYRQLLQAGGIDPSFMNQNQYAEWIGKDISPTEIQDRVNLAVQATVNAPPETITAFARMGINAGDLASYFLNDQTPPPVLQQKLAQAQIIEAGLQAGVANPSVGQAAEFAKMGTTYQQALSGYQKIADLLPAADQLSQIYSAQQPYGQAQAEREFLGNSGTAQLAREQLGRQEIAAFSGAGAVGQKSFAQQNAGTGF